MSREIELLEKQLAFWKHHSAELSKELTKEEEISNHYAELLDKTEEELQAERVKNEEQGYRKQSEVIEEYRQRVNAKMGKHTHLLSKEYVQRILREVAKEMKGGAE